MLTLEQFLASARHLSPEAAGEELGLPASFWSGAEEIVLFDGGCYVTKLKTGGYWSEVQFDDFESDDLKEVATWVYNEWYTYN